MTTAVVVMAKAPRPGLAKTRLHPLLGPDGSAALQAALIASATATAASVLPTWVAIAPAGAAAEVVPLLPDGVGTFDQVEGDLGVRMAAAVATVHARTGGPVLVIGTDAPTLRAEHLEAAAAVVGGGAAALGPALDGGYWLIGLPEPLPAAFAIPPDLWSGPEVLTATRRALEGAGRTVELLAPLRDLDTPDDAAALLAEAAEGEVALPPEVAALLSLAAPG
ncbi:MAG TPA: TIGR04282 family arsenosugar biosynthesis glycosyltransferase [Acidimicrobiales bacterium]|nr:TIGR04282 family arsenosugar biosynthesis glycosyltransferase [Acidimicrobiales bacterium]